MKIRGTRRLRISVILQLCFVLVNGSGQAYAKTVNILSPKSHAKVSGLVTISIKTNSKVKCVDYELDGVQLGGGPPDSYSVFTWNSSTVPNGHHKITVNAYSSCLTATTSLLRSVTVDDYSSSSRSSTRLVHSVSRNVKVSNSQPTSTISVSSLTLIDTDTAQPISPFDPIASGATINLATLPTQNLTIRANTSPATVGSVKFDLNGHSNTVNTSPYYLCGPLPCSNLGAGLYSLTTTPYVGSDGSGAAGTSMSISFSVVSSTATPTPASSPTPSPTPTPSGLNLLTGSYSGCTSGIGSGCAKGDYRSGSDATVSTSSSTLTTPTGSFTSADVGKHGVAVDWNAPNVTGAGTSCSAWSGYACYSGVSCPFTVSTVNSSTSITVSLGSGCGGSGIGFNAAGNGYWAVYTDDSTALLNALSAAATAAEPLYVPATYQGGILTGPTMPNGATIQCGAGATFYNPNFSLSTSSSPLGISSQILKIAGTSNNQVTGCTFSGTQPTGGAWYNPTREFDVGIPIFKATDTLITGNTFKNFWGTYVVGTSGASNVKIDGNLFQNCGYYGVQLAEAGGSSPYSSVTNNIFSDCSYGSEDAGAYLAGTNTIQIIQNNTMFLTNGGTGYNRSQTLLGLGALGSVFINPGIACSGPPCNSNQYQGVTVDLNHVSGAGSHIFNGSVRGPVNGATVINNTCDNGCTYQ